MGTPPLPDNNGVCTDYDPFAQLCPTGGCCLPGSFCLATDEEGTIFVCATDRTIPGSTEPIPDDNGHCSDNFELCPTGGESEYCTQPCYVLLRPFVLGCCATQCLATDA